MEKNTQPKSKSNMLSPPLSLSLSLNSTDQKNHLNVFSELLAQLVRVNPELRPPESISRGFLKAHLAVLRRGTEDKWDSTITHHLWTLPKSDYHAKRKRRGDFLSTLASRTPAALITSKGFLVLFFHPKLSLPCRGFCWCQKCLLALLLLFS